MDGRIQEPTIKFLKEKYNTQFVDTITEPGPCKILAERTNKTLLQTLKTRIDISVHKHGSKLIAISGHHDCAGNPVSEEIQKEEVLSAILYLKKDYPEVEFIGLWIGEDWVVKQLT
jgi:hypothetical protein